MAPASSDLYAMPPAGRVLTDPALLRSITSYLRGLPMLLYEFWVAHEPTIASSQDPDLVYKGIDRLMALVVQHGTPQLVELTANVPYRRHNWPSNEWKTRGLAGVVKQATRANRAGILEYALTHNAPCEKICAVWTPVFDFYKNDGDLRVLDLLRIHKPIPSNRLKRMRPGIKDVRLAKWLDLHFPGALNPQIMDFAASAGNLEMVQHLLANYPTTKFSTWSVERAYQLGYREILRCLLEKRPRQAHQQFVKQLLLGGDQEVIEMLRDLGGFTSRVYHAAVTLVIDGNAEILPRLFDNGLLTKDSSFSIDEPASQGHLDTVKLLTERATTTATKEAMDNAARSGKWELVEYLHENRTEGCTAQAMDGAAKRGAHEVVQFLHENRSEGCTTAAMDQAAGAGHLTVVQYLHANRREGCTTQAMDQAAGAGHFAVVQYLHANRREGCTSAAVKRAAREGHLEIVQFLYEHYRSQFSPDTLHDLLLHGAFDIWMELRVLYPEQANAVIEPVTVEAGEKMELATIQFVIEELGRQDLAHLAVDGAAKNTFHQDTKWPRTVFAVTGPGSCRLSAIRNAVESAPYDSKLFKILYLVSICSEKGAHELAISVAKENRHKRSIVWTLERLLGDQHHSQLLPVAPLLLDERCPLWAIDLALGEFRFVQDPYYPCESPIPWAIQAIYRGDQTLLEVLRDLHSSGKLEVYDKMVSFEGSRAAAIRKGNLILLQWLLDNVQELPVETTLLDEALYYHQFEIAEWLAVHCVDGCREFDWSNKVKASWLGPCGLDTVLLDWVQSSAAVRSLVDFGGLASYAAGAGGVAVLRKLHASHPEIIMALADRMTGPWAYPVWDGDADVMEFLQEIQGIPAVRVSTLMLEGRELRRHRARQWFDFQCTSFACSCCGF